MVLIQGFYIFQICPSEIFPVLELGGYDSCGVVQLEFGQVGPTRVDAFAQFGHDFTSSSMCLDTPGRHTDEVMHRWHLWMS